MSKNSLVAIQRNEGKGPNVHITILAHKCTLIDINYITSHTLADYFIIYYDLMKIADKLNSQMETYESDAFQIVDENIS